MRQKTWAAAAAGMALLLAACGTAGPATGGYSAPGAATGVSPAPAPTGIPTPAVSVVAPASTSPAAVASSVLSVASPIASASKPLSQNTVRFAIPVSSGLQVLPQLAQEAGYFKDEGLDVSISFIGQSPNVIAALASGDLEMANSDSPSVIQAHMSGAPVVILAVPVIKPIFDFMVAPTITRPEELKGKTVGITQLCDSSCFQITRALQSWGLKAQEDVPLLALRDYPGMYAALTTNQIAGAPLAPPFNFQAKQLGYHSLADLSQLPIEYPTAVVQTSQAFATAHPDTVQAFLRAYVRAIRRYKADEAFTVDVYRRFLKSNDTAVLQQTWEYYQRLMQSDPTPTASGIKFVLDSLAQSGDKRAAAANPAEFIQPQFIAQVLASGALNP